jgi:hypothetical protein
MTNTHTNKQTAWVRWLLLGLIIVFQLLVLIIAPEEKTLGLGIKPVYLHVSLTWAGMLLLAISVILGLIVLLGGKSKNSVWLDRVLNSGFVFYGFGFVVSMYASMINWGGVPFNEPAVRQAMSFLLIGVVLWLFSKWIGGIRFRGGIGLLAAGMLLMATESSQSILHPESPVNSSPLSIKSTFYIMFGLAIFLSIWTLDFQRSHSKIKVLQTNK